MTTPPPPPPGYGPPPPGYGPPPGGGVPGELVGWGSRVQSAIIDYFGPAIVAGIVVNAISRPLGLLLVLAAFGWGLYNGYLQGETGQSTGKKIAGTKLLSTTTGQPIGGGAGVGRAVVHIVDGIPCYLGYLWPLWDAKKQTFADKIMSTVVVKA